MSFKNDYELMWKNLSDDQKREIAKHAGIDKDFTTLSLLEVKELIHDKDGQAGIYDFNWQILKRS